LSFVFKICDFAFDFWLDWQTLRFKFWRERQYYLKFLTWV